jgi:hypothetical protein
MAFEPDPNTFNYLGFVLWGDLGPFTMYRSSRGHVVWFLKTWPHKQPSAKQLAWRAQWAAAAAAWKALSQEARRQWDLATRRASLCCHGYDLFIHWALTGDDTAIATLERQTRTTLLPT